MNIKYRLLCKRLIEERKRVGVIQYYNVLFIMELVSDKDIWALSADSALDGFRRKNNHAGYEPD